MVINKNMKQKLLLMLLCLLCLLSCGERKNRLSSEALSHITAADVENTMSELKLHDQEPKSKSFYTDLLESFCKRHYNDCFEGRRYVYSSIDIDDVEYLSNTHVKITGTHGYKGKFGKEYYGMKFKADILEKEKDFYVIEFQKESAPDLVHDTSYWESGTINFLY